MKVRIPQGPSRADLMQQLQKFQDDTAALQEDLDAREYSATAGGGLVSVTVNGLHEVKSVKISPEALEDAEMVEDLVTVALNEAIGNARKTSEEEMAALQNSMNLPSIPGLV
ncbi:MAG: YbaB/EbfC family nucleoid-associated protein [Oscillospiraceae bacterium]|nr:YbaB/EbfC family nucleoid-associated protein [Candidatus Equicaccousia limihippi]